MLVVPVSVLAVEVQLAWRPERWSGLPGLALDIVLLDFLIYWGHRANHEAAKPLMQAGRPIRGLAAAWLMARKLRVGTIPRKGRSRMKMYVWRMRFV